MARNAVRYFTGLPCVRGHVAERMVSTKACVVCLEASTREWRESNPDKVNEQKRNWRNANIEKARTQNLANQKLHRDAANVRNRRYAASHREELKAKNAEWERKNPDRVMVKVAKRRASKLNQTPAWANLKKIDQIYAWASVLRLAGADVHVDHIVPLQGRSVSGLHVHDNLQILNAHQNRVKANHLQGVH